MKKVFTIFIALLFLGVVTTNAAIVYTDVNPDVTTTLNQNPGYIYELVKIDFDGDGVEEYNFRWDDYGSFGWFMHMTYAAGNEFILKGTAVNPYGGRYLQALDANYNINATENWGSSNPEPFIGDDSDPNFQNLGDKYVGVKFTLGTNTYYGWVLVSFDSNRTLTVKEYAYENVPNTPINAGDAGTSSVMVSFITVQGQGGISSINTLGGTLQMETVILPANASDNTVTWSVINSTGEATIDANGLLTAINGGDVTVTATADDGSGISGSTVITLSNQLSIFSDFSNSGFIVYPNPAVDFISIENAMNINTKSVSIYSVDGKLMHEHLKISNTATIDIQSWKEGIYLIKIQYNKGQYQTSRIIKR